MQRTHLMEANQIRLPEQAGRRGFEQQDRSETRPCPHLQRRMRTGEAGGGARVPAQALLRHQSKAQAQPQVKVQRACHRFPPISECLKYMCHDSVWQVQRRARLAGGEAGKDARAEQAAPKRERRPRGGSPCRRLVTRARTLVSRIG